MEVGNRESVKGKAVCVCVCVLYVVKYLKIKFYKDHIFEIKLLS